MVKVYWIHKKEHTDILTEGYVGVTCDIDTRLEFHTKRNKNHKLRNAINKYKNEIAVDIVYEFQTEKEALEKEIELRPNPFIGWNLAEGGGKPPSIKDYPEAIEKIRQSVKKLNMTPYCEKTHSKETLEKAKKTRKECGYKWYHNPETLEYKMIATNKEDIPFGWAEGRKPKHIYEKKTRNVDYFCNAKTWNIVDPNGNEYTVKNLKPWCKERSLPYFATMGSGEWKGWRFKKV